MSVTSFDQLDLEGYYTYQDYLTWKFPERVELFLGRVFKMSPAPNVRHQRISLNLIRSLGNFLLGNSCSVFHAPFDVRLPISSKKGLKDTVVQPDIVVLCDESKLDNQGCNGAPDMVIEILSPGNSTREMKEKFALYEASLIPEYWIIDPVHQDIIIYTLDADKQYIGSKPYLSGDSITSSVLSSFIMQVSEVFHD